MNQLLDGLSRGESRMVVINGGLGGGKSAVLHEISRRAGTSATSLMARCAPDEAGQRLATVRQLLQPLAPEGADPLPDGDVAELYDLARAAAASTPLCLLVDDVQWADEESVDFLAYLLRRFHQTSVLLMVSLDEQEPSPRWPQLARLVHDPSAAVFHLAPLHHDAVRVLCLSLLDTADEPVVAACRRLTAGVPYLLIELLTEAARLRGDDGEPLVDTLERCGSPTVAAVATERARRHGAHVIEVLKRLCVIRSPLPARYLADIVDGPEAATADAVETLRRLSLVRADDGIIVAPPLVRHAVHRALSPSDRHAAEIRVARALVSESGEAEAAALHLMESFPIGAVEHVAILRAAAAAASARGRAQVASTFLRRALREPPPADQVAEIMVELGAAETHYDGTAGVRHLREALIVTVDPQQRARVVLRLAHALCLVARVADAATTLEDELSATTLPGDHELVQRMAAELQFASFGEDAVRQGVRARHGMPAATRARLAATNHRGTRGALAVRALNEALAGQPFGPVLDDVGAALNGPLSPSDDGCLGLLTTGLVLVWGDDLGAAHRFFSEAQAESLGAGSVLCASLAAWMLGLAEVRRGRLGPAEERISQASELVADPRWHRWRFTPMIAAAELAVERGSVPDLLSAAARDGLMGELPLLLLAHVGLARRGWLRVLGGDVRRGLDDLREAGRRLGAIGCANPAVAPWRSDAAMALRQLGAPEQGFPLIEEEVRLARQWGSPRPLAIALRRRALLLAQDGSRQQEDLETSLRLLDSCGMPLERARTLLALGRVNRLRRHVSTARTLLDEARALALASAAHGLLVSIDEELVMAGGRPRLRRGGRGSPLTAGEDRVARLAVRGQTNEEIARELFVARRTVEVHLTSVYRKLNIRGRSGLAEALEGLSE